MSDRQLKVRMIFEAMDRFTRPMREMAAATTGMRQPLAGTRAELERLQDAANDVTAFRTLKRAVLDTSRDADAAEARVRELATAIAATDNPTKAMAREFARAQREARALKTAHGEQSRELQTLRDRLSAAGLNTRNLAGDERELRDRIAATTRELSRQNDVMARRAEHQQRMARATETMERRQEIAGNLASAGAGSVAAGAAIAAPMVAGVQQAGNWRDGMIDVAKVLPDAKPAQLAALSSQLQGLANRLPLPRQGIVEIAAEAARAGVPINELAGFTENAAQMAAAFDIEARDAGAMMATWRTAMKLSGPATVALGDDVNALTNKFGGSAPEVAAMITRIGPLGEVAGASGGALAAMAQMMNSVGVQSEIGATGIKNMLLAMTKGDAATKSQAAAFQALGLDARQVSEQMQTDAEGAITKVLESVARLPAAQQAGILTQLFGSESVAAIAPLLSNLDRLKENFALVGDASQTAGSLQAEFQTAMGKTGNKLIVAQNAAGGIAAAFGAPLEGPMRKMADRFAGMAERITRWTEKHPKLTAAIAWTTAGLAALLIVGGGLLILASALMAPFAMLPLAMAGIATASLTLAPIWAGLTGGLAAAATGTWAFTAALLANPLTWMIGLVIAFAVAAFLIYRNWDRISAFFSRKWEEVLAGWNAFTARWRERLNALPQWFRDLGGGIVNALIGMITGNPGRVFEAVRSIVRGALNAGKALLGLGSAPNAATPAGTTAPGLQRRATGGAFMPGWLLTGEQGPELRYESRAGFIAHHRQLAEMTRMTDRIAGGGSLAPRMVAASAAILASITATPASALPLDRAAPAAQRGGASSAPAASFHYTININAGGAGTPQDIAREVERVIEGIEARREARARSAYDYDGADET